MKQEMLGRLERLKASLVQLKKELNELKPKTVSKKSLRLAADDIANQWVEEIRSPLEHKFKLDKPAVEETSELMKNLHVLSRPNNLKTSYLRCINKILKGYDDKLVLPVKQASIEVNEILDLQKLIPGLSDPEESDYFREAIDCAQGGYYKAAIVMGWCAVIDKIQKKIISIGFEKFNTTSKNIKNQKRGKFKNWNKEFSVSTLSELQEVFDTDLLVILQGMGLIDGNQAERLAVCFQYRNHSAHPGLAPVEPTHVVSFFTDIVAIILQNPKLAI